MSNRKYRIAYTPSCWNCRKLRKSKRIIHENTLDKPHGGDFLMSAPSIMDALAGYMCNNYWFGDKPDEDMMLCDGKEYESVYR